MQRQVTRENMDSRIVDLAPAAKRRPSKVLPRRALPALSDRCCNAGHITRLRFKFQHNRSITHGLPHTGNGYTLWAPKF